MNYLSAFLENTAKKQKTVLVKADKTYLTPVLPPKKQKTVLVKADKTYLTGCEYSREETEPAASTREVREFDAGAAYDPAEAESYARECFARGEITLAQCANLLSFARSASTRKAKTHHEIQRNPSHRNF
jgi:hypothetical protein